MGNFLKRKLGELIEERAEYDRRKTELLSQIDALSQQLASNNMLLEDYASAVSVLKEQVSKHNDTIVYYTNRISEVKKQEEEEKKVSIRVKMLKEASKLIVSAVIILLTFAVFVVSEGHSGFFD